jgi:hypothetical protein
LDEQPILEILSNLDIPERLLLADSGRSTRRSVPGRFLPSNQSVLSGAPGSTASDAIAFARTADPGYLTLLVSAADDHAYVINRPEQSTHLACFRRCFRREMLSQG